MSWPDWHLGALRQQDRGVGRVGVEVEFSAASSAENSAASPICTRSPAATRIRPVFLPRHGFGQFFLPRHGFGQGLDSFSKTGVTFAYELRFRRSTTQNAQGKKFCPTKLTSSVSAFRHAQNFQIRLGTSSFCL